MRILALDPGLTGGLAIISEDGVIVEPMPSLDGVLDLATLARLIKFHTPNIAYLEKVGARPGQGVSSMFKFGRVFGALEGLLTGLGIPYRLITPQAWTKVMHQGVERSVDPKKRSIIAASRLFPDVDLLATERSKVPHSGMADALLLAEYGRRQGI